MLTLTVYNTNNVAHEALLDDDWEYAKNDRFTINSDGYLKYKGILVHQKVMKSDPYQTVDHINKNKLDNRKKNLRFATGSENSHNRTKKENAKSKWKGVHPDNGRYTVRITKKGVDEDYYGQYAIEEHAAWAYNLKAVELYGTFADLNDLEEPKGFVLAQRKEKNDFGYGITYDKRLYRKNRYMVRVKSKRIGEYEHLEDAREAVRIALIEWEKEKKLKKDQILDLPIFEIDGIAIIKASENGRECLFVKVDHDMWHNLMQYKWYKSTGDNTYIAGRVKGEQLSLSSYITGLYGEMKPAQNMKIDHVNHNPLDNKRCNLRLVSDSTNSHNKAKMEGTSTTFLGVSVKRPGKFQANIKFKGDNFYLGLYSSEMEAAWAYDEKAREFHGDYANTNNVAKPSNFKRLVKRKRAVNDE